MKIYNNFLLSILIIGWSILSHAQCNLTATSSGGNLGYTQVYILVDQSGNIVAQNPTGTFNSVANGVYQIHALNYDPLNPPNPLPIALIGQPLTDVGSSTLGCFNGDLLTDYVTQVCSSCAQTLEFCGTEPVVITSSGSAVGYTQLYVLVDTSSGLVIATNLTGNFTSDVVIGNTYTVHALNYNSSDAPIPLPTVGQDVLQTGSTYQGCANSDFLLDYVCVNINALPDAPSASTTTQPDCLAPTGTITVTAPIGGVIEYSVDGITYQSSTVFSGLAPGDYNITAQDNVTLCTSLITVVTVDPVPSPPAEPATACYETATFNTTTCVWDVTGTQPLEPATACYETATFNTTLCVWDVTGTQDSPPTVSTVQPDCINITGTINISAPTGANIEYSIDGITFQSSPTFSGLIPGNYDVVAQDVSIGCASISAPISIDNIPSAEQVDAGIDVFILQNESATLTASGNGTFLWSTNENTNSISVSPLVDTEYCVTLTDINNCTSNDCVTIFLTPEDEDCEELFIPTAFSPNNDNNNDLYQIRINASCVQSMSMLIFDRWGELIVEMTDPNESWDGTYKDEPLNTASFAYVLRIKLSNNPEEQEFKGNITLVK